ncbi:hypothetical protein [Hyphomonas sp.]|uniref:hypothetical protein n=1 Tax=Hyphomonas sp. TaxID=87 RepID=UPI003918CF22
MISAFFFILASGLFSYQAARAAHRKQWAPMIIASISSVNLFTLGMLQMVLITILAEARS